MNFIGKYMVWLVKDSNGSDYVYSEEPGLRDAEFWPQKPIYYGNESDIERCCKLYGFKIIL